MTVPTLNLTFNASGAAEGARRGDVVVVVDVAVEHRIPALRQVRQQLIARLAAIQRQAPRQDEQVLVALAPQLVDDVRH